MPEKEETKASVPAVNNFELRDEDTTSGTSTGLSSCCSSYRRLDFLSEKEERLTHVSADSSYRSQPQGKMR
jgi:hypothetical protein